MSRNRNPGGNRTPRSGLAWRAPAGRGRIDTAARHAHLARRFIEVSLARVADRIGA